MPDQLERMNDLAKRGVCAFCPEHIEAETTHPKEVETRHWYVKKNDYPYENTALHLLIIPKKHVKTTSELPKEAQAEFLILAAELEQKYNLDSYALGMRSGDMRYNGGSVEHLHAHLIVADKNQKTGDAVRFKMGSRPEPNS